MIRKQSRFHGLSAQRIGQFAEIPDPSAAPEPQAFDATALDDTALTAEYSRIRARGQVLSTAADLDAAGAAELSELAARATAVQSEITARNERNAAVTAQREMFASAPELSITPSAPVAAPETVAQAPTVPATVEVPSVAEMAVQPPVVVPTKVEKKSDRVTAVPSQTAMGILGLQPGDVYGGSGDIAKVLIKNAQSFGRTGAPGQRQTIAQFHRDRGAELSVDTDNVNETNAVLRHARDEKRLSGGNLSKTWADSVLADGGSLTAAAGWCAPSENDYTLCRNWDAPVGLIDLPTVTATRGGINYTDEPTFPEIYANAVAVGGGSNFLTEAQVIADTPKTCSEIPCPTFENRRLDVMALCIRVSFLQAAGYPEVVSAWDAGLRAAHEAEMNRLIIADLLARAGAATVLPDIDGTAGQQDSFTSALLAGVELAAEDIRYRFHMAWNNTVEIVLPHWVIPIMRADVSRRNGWNGLGVTDAEIASWFAARNIRPQFVRGWQDGLITGGALNAAFPGGIAATPFLTALPSTVSFLAFPAGSVVVARQDVVTLTNVYDAASLAVNEFTALFAEEGFANLYPCPGQRLYTVTGCAAGVTGAANIDCIT